MFLNEGEKENFLIRESFGIKLKKKEKKRKERETELETEGAPGMF